jgi:NAD(P)-dependent dehydrogenase (short-subunit alcohol dehydrogenase family)
MSETSDKWNRRSAIKAAGIALAGAAIGAVSAKAATGKKEQPLAGQVALITGAARGIGLSCAKRLADQGANIAICDIAEQIASVPYPLSTEEELENAAKEVRLLGVKCISFKVDTRDSESVAKMVQSIKTGLGRIDILVANAGIGIMGKFTDSIAGNVWRDVIDVNLHGTANCINRVLPVMMDQNYGRIVTISSQMGRKGSAGASAYTASKWAIIGLSKSIALEAGKNGITCNCVCPSATDTGMLNNDVTLPGLSPDDPTIEGFSNKLASMNPIPIGVVSPDRVADLVEILCMPQSGHLSGTVLDVAANESSRNLG